MWFWGTAGAKTLWPPACLWSACAQCAGVCCAGVQARFSASAAAAHPIQRCSPLYPASVQHLDADAGGTCADIRPFWAALRRFPPAPPLVRRIGRMHAFPGRFFPIQSPYCVRTTLAHCVHPLYLRPAAAAAPRDPPCGFERRRVSFKPARLQRVWGVPAASRLPAPHPPAAVRSPACCPHPCTGGIRLRTPQWPQFGLATP